jgi:hypothetical protein
MHTDHRGTNKSNAQKRNKGKGGQAGLLCIWHIGVIWGMSKSWI